jgi:cytosine/adenosine deaminase-related metal-dependent hydrolase
MQAEARTFAARWVFPVSGPPLDRGTVTVCGDRIEAVEPRGVRTADEDLGNVAILPGLVNAHTHLDLSGARGRIPPTDPDHFTDWLKGVIAYRRTRTPEQTQQDIRDGLAECLRAGTTLIGDIASEGASWGAVSGAKTRAVVYYELIGLSRERADAAIERAREFMRRVAPSSTSPLEGEVGETQSSREGGWNPERQRRGEPHHPVAGAPGSTPPPANSSGVDDLPLKGGGVKTTRLGFSPHAPYSASQRLIRCLSEPGMRVAIHIAESPAEVELIRSKSGPMVEFLTSLGVWHPDQLIPSLKMPSQFYTMNDHALFVHCNYEPRDVFRCLVPHYSVAYCPRTHAAFGHPPHPFREFLARGVRVCLGTDSLASNPDLDILAEARFVRSRYPDFPGDQLLRMVTLSGAEALGWADECGSLESGKSADFVTVPLPNEEGDPYELVLREHGGERRTMWRGEWRV